MKLNTENLVFVRRVDSNEPTIYGVYPKRCAYRCIRDMAGRQIMNSHSVTIKNEELYNHMLSIANEYDVDLELEKHNGYWYFEAYYDPLAWDIFVEAMEDEIWKWKEEYMCTPIVETKYYEIHDGEVLLVEYWNGSQFKTFILESPDGDIDLEPIYQDREYLLSLVKRKVNSGTEIDNIFYKIYKEENNEYPQVLFPKFSTFYEFEIRLEEPLVEDYV